MTANNNTKNKKRRRGGLVRRTAGRAGHADRQGPVVVYAALARHRGPPDRFRGHIRLSRRALGLCADDDVRDGRVGLAAGLARIL